MTAPFRPQIADAVSIPFHEVDAHNVVPCWHASDKRETGARTIRSKINKQVPEFLEVSGCRDINGWVQGCPLQGRPLALPSFCTTCGLMSTTGNALLQDRYHGG